VLPTSGRIYRLLFVGLWGRDSEHDTAVFIVGVGHYSLVKVPDLLAGSFPLGTYEFFVTTDKFLVVAYQFLMALETLPGEVFILFKAVVDALELDADALKFALHFLRQPVGSLGEFTDTIYCGGSKADDRNYHGCEACCGCDFRCFQLRGAPDDGLFQGDFTLKGTVPALQRNAR